MDLNKVQIIGNNTKDIELKVTTNGSKVATFSVATNRKWTDSNGSKQESTEFHNIVLWGKLAEIAEQFLQKGKKVYIEGRLQTRSWEAQDGTKRYTTEIIGEQLILLGGGKTDGGYAKPKSEEQAETKVDSKQEEEISVEDIPF